MSSRWHRYLAEAGRFLAVGGLATVVALILFNLLVHGVGAGAPLADQPVLAYVVANSFGMAISYQGSRNWAFRDRPPVHADGGLTAFVAINLLTMLLPIGCLSVSREVLGLDDAVSDNVAANVIGLALGMAARFWLFRTFVFRRPITLNDLYTPEAVAAGEAELPRLPILGLSEPTTGPARRGPAPPPAP